MIVLFNFSGKEQAATLDAIGVEAFDLIKGQAVHLASARLWPHQYMWCCVGRAL